MKATDAARKMREDDVGALPVVRPVVRTAVAGDRPAENGPPLTASQISDVMSGNAATFPAADLQMIEVYFAPDGELRGLYKGDRFTGRWSVENGQLCLDLSGTVDDACWSVVRLGDEAVQIFTAIGEPAGHVYLEEGNPQGF